MLTGCTPQCLAGTHQKRRWEGIIIVTESSLKRILLLEDDLALGGLMAAALRRSGPYEVEHTRSISDAVEELETERYDLALFDVWIAGKLATDAVRLAARQRVPVILSSGDELPEAITAIAPKSAFLRKPAPIADLLVCVEASLAAAQPRTC